VQKVDRIILRLSLVDVRKCQQRRGTTGCMCAMVWCNA